MEERKQKQKERMLAAESRRKQEEEYKKQKILKAEGICILVSCVCVLPLLVSTEERRMIEEIHRKRMEVEDERRKVEAAEREKQRLREREEREATEREKEAELKRKMQKVLPTTDKTDKVLQHWKQQRKAAKDATAVSRLPPISPFFSLAKPALHATFSKLVPCTAAVSTPQLSNCHQKYAEIDSYQLIPANPLEEADNYSIADLSSDDSTDNESCPKKKVPKWAASAAVNRVVNDQVPCDLSNIFKVMVYNIIAVCWQL